MELHELAEATRTSSHALRRKIRPSQLASTSWIWTKECRKYGISLVLASQEARDFDVSVFSAIANYLVLRLTEVDAKSLVRNVANSQRERGLIDKIKQLERFKAMYFCEERKTAAQIALSPSL